ncbi:pectinesterase [Senna tora]|uniref:Pectinesterase n=1 Tax=Senna tora TaxID=362788 RepID=A0A834W4W2_9FABA|nr:pectinesterase [Senna tora]
MALQVTMDQAIEAHKLVSTMKIMDNNDFNGGDNRAKLAWSDCLELYEDTVFQLNRSVRSYPEWVLESDRKLIEAAPGAPRPDVVVAKDGSGNYKTIAEGVAAAAKMSGGGGRRVVVHVKGGVYAENVEIKRTMKNLMIVGDGIGVTIVTGSKNAGQTTTFSSATFAVSGDNFIARDITFENTAGPAKNQAVALRCGADHAVFHRCGADHAVFHRCSFLGYQDTLYVLSQRQFYRDCDIHGTVDFIFGDAAAVFQHCNLNARKPMGGQQNVVTAHGRTDPNENTGIIIQGCRVNGLPGAKNYLGRPWKEYARTVVIASELGGIHPAGWLEWSGSFALKTLYYAEYMNTGGGAATGGRVKWPGFHVLRSPAEVSKFSVGNFLGGESWIPATNVPFDAGL